MSALDDLRDAEAAIHGAEDTDRVFALRKAARSVLDGQQGTVQVPVEDLALVVEEGSGTVHVGAARNRLRTLLAASEADPNG